MKFVSIIKSIVFNFTCFPFRVAMKMPILIGDSMEWRYLKKGCIELPENISIGMIKLGCDKGSYGVECNKHSYISIGENSKIIFKGRARFAQGISLRCDNGGTIEVGDMVSFNQNCFIASNTKICLENDIMGGVECCDKRL